MKSKKLAILSIIAVALALLGVSSKILAEPPRPGSGSEVNIQGEATIADTVRSGFSYQGRLTDKTGTPLDGQYDMVFQFWDAGTIGSQVGSDIPVNNVDVDNGLFNVTIDVPDRFFDGTALWLRVKVGDEWLDPRKEILPVPYALSLWPGADVRGSLSASDAIFTVVNEGSGDGVTGITQAETAWEDAGVYGYSVYTETYGVLGESEYGVGVQGRITNTGNSNTAVVGWNEGGGGGVHGYTITSTFGVLGESEYGNGVVGLVTNPNSPNTASVGWNAGGGKGVSGHSASTHGVYGETWAETAWEDAGVYGYSTYTETFGVLGKSKYGVGVEGWITNTGNFNTAVVGWNEGSGIGVHGFSEDSYGVYGESDTTYGVATPDGMLAPTFDVGTPDVAEYFPTVVLGLEPGDVVVIAPDTNGEFGLDRATQAYDTSVAGIVSTEPGITLGVRDGNIMPGNNEDQVPLALVGRVPCKVDASYGAIAIGDLLTTSPTPGHAMRCDDRLACLGAIIGKALEPLEDGTDVILVLVALQ
jgi:hypothetical protein